MSDNGNSGGGNGFLAFLVGGLVVVVAVLAFFMMNGHAPGPSASATKTLDVNISAPKAPGAKGG